MFHAAQRNLPTRVRAPLPSWSPPGAANPAGFTPQLGQDCSSCPSAPSESLRPRQPHPVPASGIFDHPKVLAGCVLYHPHKGPASLRRVRVQGWGAVWVLLVEALRAEQGEWTGRWFTLTRRHPHTEPEQDRSDRG